LENHSRRTSFPNEEEWKPICNYMRLFSILDDHKVHTSVLLWLLRISR
jgi:hypothetical protein